MVAVWACLWLSCLVSSSSSYNYPAWPEQLVDQSMHTTDDVEQLVGESEDSTDGDAPERKLFLPQIAAGMLRAVGLGGVSGLVSGAFKLLTGPIAKAVVKFAGVLLSSLGVLTSDGEAVAKHLQKSHEHRNHMATMSIADMQHFLDIDFTEAQSSHAIEHMGKHMEEDSNKWATWWTHGMKNKYVGCNTMPPMEDALKDAMKWAHGYSLDVGRVVPVVPATIKWMTYPLPMMCSLVLLGGSLAAAMRMWHRTKHLAHSERSFGDVVGDAAFVE